ncbi:MAG: hypothetical protein ABIP71_12475 [Verrucomicrobiota bacterium]
MKTNGREGSEGCRGKAQGQPEFLSSTGRGRREETVAELVLVYGRGVTLHAHEGVPTHCSLFARIPGDWKYDWMKFALECRKARWEGPQVLRVERVE